MPHTTTDAGNRNDADSELASYAAATSGKLGAYSAPTNTAELGSHRRSWGPRQPKNKLRLRRSIRAKMMLILLLPILAIALLGGGHIVQLWLGAASAAQVNQVAALSARANELVGALQAERAAAATILAGNLTASDADFTTRRNTTGTAARKFSSSAADLSNTALFSGAITRAQRAVDSVTSLAREVEHRSLNSSQAATRYSSAISAVLAVTDRVARSAATPELANRLRSAALFSHYGEASSAEGYLLYTAAVGSGFDPETYRNFLASLRDQQAYLEQFEQISNPTDQRLVEQQLNRSQLSGLIATQTAAVGSGPSGELNINSDEWLSAASTKAKIVNTVQRRLADRLSDSSSAERIRQLLYMAGVALLTLGLIALSALISLRVARYLAHSLGALHSSALNVAQQSLPALVEQLHDIDGARGSAPRIAQVHAAAIATLDQQLTARAGDEIGDVACALNLVHRETIDIAVQQAQLRLSVAATFINLARRSQLLVDRLIGLIDKLEHSERNPDRLAELFQLDHLITRMRRNDENLLVLVGAEGGRRWTHTASLQDVLHAATAEIEQCTRVKIGNVVPVAVCAHAVSDVVHLVAELAENATTFSPPQTDVILQTRISRGVVVLELTDRGIGMSPQQLEELNERLRSPGAMDAGASRMMGLHVVAKLAARHEIAVTLKPTNPVGTVAAVTLPATLLQAPDVGGTDVGGTDVGGTDVGGTDVGGTDVGEAKVGGTEIGGTSEAAEPHEMTMPAADAFDSAAWAPAELFIPPPPSAIQEKVAPWKVPLEDEQSTELVRVTSNDEQSTQFVSPATVDDEQSTEFVSPATVSRSQYHDHKHWRYGELANHETPVDVTLSIFESIESKWFREVPAESEAAYRTANPERAEQPLNPSSTTASGVLEQSIITTRPSVNPDVKPAAGDRQLPKAPSATTTEIANAASPLASANSPVRARFPMSKLSSPTVGNSSLPTQMRPEWQSAADVGWQRAIVAVTPRAGGLTAAGLPKRVPMANYVPGSVWTPEQIAAAGAPLERSPEAIGAGLARYHSGVEHGRQLARTGNLGSPATNNSSEEYI